MRILARNELNHLVQPCIYEIGTFHLIRSVNQIAGSQRYATQG